LRFNAPFFATAPFTETIFYFLAVWLPLEEEEEKDKELSDGDSPLPAAAAGDGRREEEKDFVSSDLEEGKELPPCPAAVVDLAAIHVNQGNNLTERSDV